MSDSRRDVLKKNMKKALDEDDPLYHLNLGFNMEFQRKYPPGTDMKAKIT